MLKLALFTFCLLCRCASLFGGHPLDLFVKAAMAMSISWMLYSTYNQKRHKLRDKQVSPYLDLHKGIPTTQTAEPDLAMSQSSKHLLSAFPQLLRCLNVHEAAASVRTASPTRVIQSPPMVGGFVSWLTWNPCGLGVCSCRRRGSAMKQCGIPPGSSALLARCTYGLEQFWLLGSSALFPSISPFEAWHEQWLWLCHL